MNKSRNCIKSPSNAILVPLLKCNKIIGRGKINLNKAPPIGKYYNATHIKDERDAKYEVSTIFNASVFVVIFIFR